MSGVKKKAKKPTSTTISHRALDELVKFQTAVITDIGKFKTEIITAVNEIGNKQNDLAAHVMAVEGVAKNTAAFAASEMGKMGGSFQRHLNDLDVAVNAIDLNVLALAEVAKEVIGQLTQIDALMGRLHAATKTIFSHSHSGLNEKEPGFVHTLTPEDLEAFRTALVLADSDIQEIKSTAETWYGKLVASAFKTVRERTEAEDRARREKEAAAAKEAKEAAEKAASNKAEVQAVADEMQKANAAELSVAVTTSGGSGAPFPEGAEIFGG